MQDRKKEIRPYNNKRQRHGYWEVYFSNTLWNKCFYVNDIKLGFSELYNTKEYYAR